jgi:hypothetical protein
MKYLTFLDYKTLEVTGKNFEKKLEEKEIEVQRLKELDKIRSEEFEILKEKQDKFESFDSRLQLLEELFQEKRPTDYELGKIFHTAIKIQRVNQEQK